MTPPAHVPHVQLASVLAGEQQLGIDAVLHHVGCAPGAGHHRVEPEMPPHVVGQFLRSAIELPASTNLERLRIEQERAARPVAVGRAERAEKNPVRPAVHGVRRRVARAPGNGLRLDDLHDARPSGIGLRVENVNARRVDARHDQIAPFHVRMRRVGAQAGTARVPAEVVELVPRVRHVGLANQPAVTLRGRIQVHDAERVGASFTRVDECDISQRLRRGLRRHRRRGIERRVGCQLHRLAP